MTSKGMWNCIVLLFLLSAGLDSSNSSRGTRTLWVTPANGQNSDETSAATLNGRFKCEEELSEQKKKVFKALALDSPEAHAFLSKFHTESQKLLIVSFKPGDAYGGDGLHAEPISHHQFTVIWLHGMAQPLQDYPALLTTILLDENILRHTKFIVPQAPLRDLTYLPCGQFAAWADVLDVHPRGGEDEAGWTASTDRICDMVQREAKRISENLGISVDEAASRIAVGGISQGGALAYSVTLRCPVTPQTTVVVAGWLPLASQYPAKLSDGLKADRSKANFLVLHGEDDEVVKPIWARLSFLGLKQVLSIRGKFLTYHGINHAVCAEEVQEVQHFVTDQFTLGFTRTGKLRVTFQKQERIGN